MRKKILFILVLFLIPFTVFAKNVEYEWGKQKERGMLFVEEKDNKYVIYEPNNQSANFVTYETNGKKVSSKELTDYEYDVMDDTIHNLRSTGEYYYDTALGYYELIPKLGIVKVWNNDTNQYDEHNYIELSEADQKKYTGDYHLLFELYKNGSTDYYMYHIKTGGYVLYRIVPPINDTEEPKFFLEVYSKDEKKLLSKEIDAIDDIKVGDIDENRIYVIEAEYNHENEEANYSYVEYDLNGKELSRQNVTEEILKYGALNQEDLYYLNPYIIDSVSDGIIISLVDNYTTKEYQQCLTGKIQSVEDYCRASVLGDSIPGTPVTQEDTRGKVGTKKVVNKNDFNTAVGGHVNLRSIPTVLVKLKYDVDYQITPKIQGEGEIKVINRSAAGGEVTFEVTPKPGYVLSAVKVTDAAGNVITFNDYKFTMPSADVTIEAVFVPGNPNTTDIAIMGIIIVGILFGAIAVINYKKLIK